MRAFEIAGVCCLLELRPCQRQWPQSQRATIQGLPAEATRSFQRQVLIPLFYGCLEEKMVRSEEIAPLLQSTLPRPTAKIIYHLLPNRIMFSTLSADDEGRKKEEILCATGLL